MEASSTDLRRSYLELMKQCLTRSLSVGEGKQGGRRRAAGLLMELLARRGLTVVAAVPGNERGVSANGALMSGLQRVLATRGLRVVTDRKGATHPACRA
jgi:hypothetical protein